MAERSHTHPSAAECLSTLIARARDLIRGCSSCFGGLGVSQSQCLRKAAGSQNSGRHEQETECNESNDNGKLATDPVTKGFVSSGHHALKNDSEIIHTRALVSEAKTFHTSNDPFISVGGGPETSELRIRTPESLSDDAGSASENYKVEKNLNVNSEERSDANELYLFSSGKDSSSEVKLMNCCVSDRQATSNRQLKISSRTSQNIESVNDKFHRLDRSFEQTNLSVVRDSVALDCSPRNHLTDEQRDQTWICQNNSSIECVQSTSSTQVLSESNSMFNAGSVSSNLYKCITVTSGSSCTKLDVSNIRKQRGNYNFQAKDSDRVSIASSLQNSRLNVNLSAANDCDSEITPTNTMVCRSKVAVDSSRTSIAVEDSDDDTIIASKASSKADLSLDQCSSLDQLGDLLRKAFAEDLKRAEGLESTLKRRATEMLLLDNGSSRKETDCPRQMRRTWTRFSGLGVPPQGLTLPQRPGQLIMGVRREAHFYSHAYSDGVSETESEEDDDDHVTPTTSASTSSVTRGSDFISSFSSSYSTSGGLCVSSSFSSSGVAFKTSTAKLGSGSPRKVGSLDHPCRSRPTPSREVLSLDSSRGRLTRDPHVTTTKDPTSTKDVYTVSIRGAPATGNRDRSSSRESYRHSYACRESHSRDSSEEPPPLSSSTTCPEFTPSLRLSDLRHQQELRQQQQQQQSAQLQKEQPQQEREKSVDLQRTPRRSGSVSAVDQSPSSDSGTPKASEDCVEKNKTTSDVRRDDTETKLSPGEVEESQINGVQSRSKAYRIALELLETEESYVRILHLIDQEFQFRVDQENRARPMFPAENLPVMFSNVKSIYKLHHDFLLPQLRDRLASWEDNPRIGDIMTTLAPFLKMYTEYVRNFDRAIELINSCQAKCPKFAAIMADIHQLENCGGLTLQHHMLCPVQRIPRYELLLRDYLRKLPTNHPDRSDTAKALHLVATAASHANDAIRKIDEFETLLSLQERISGCVDLVSPTRTLIKQGKVGKISARSGDHQERYLYLLSDLLLLCSPRLGGRVIHGPPHRLRARYNVNNLQVVEGDNLETANTFYIRDTDKTVELYTQTLEEKESWLAALFLAIEDTYRRRSSLRRGEESSGGGESRAGVLGVEAPMLIPVDGINNCMSCGASFSMVRRKHHCRACGGVFCGKCSSHKASLPCEGGRTVKVCRDCHPQLQGMSAPAGEGARDSGSSGGSSRLSSTEGPDLVYRTRGVLEVSAGAQGAVLKGPLLLRTTPRKGWQERYFALHPDFVLYSFTSAEDTTAVTATPLPGYTVTPLVGARGDGVSDKERERAFKLHYSKKQYFFLAPTKEDCAKWAAALQRAARAEAPEPT